MKPTSGGELGVKPLAHDPLQPKTRTHERETHECQRIGPCRVCPLIRNARLSAFPHGYCRCHGEERLDERAQDKPQTGHGTDSVAEAANEGTHVECDERGQGLLICFMEGVVAVPWWAFEEAG